MHQYSETPIPGPPPGNLTRTYDANGNLLQRDPPGPPQPDLFAYDAYDRLVAFTEGASGIVTEYAYDPLGRRVGKRFDALGAPVESFYAYAEDSTALIEETDDAGATTGTFVWSPTPGGAFGVTQTIELLNVAGPGTMGFDYDDEREYEVPFACPYEACEPMRRTGIASGTNRGGGGRRPRRRRADGHSDRRPPRLPAARRHRHAPALRPDRQRRGRGRPVVRAARRALRVPRLRRTAAVRRVRDPARELGDRQPVHVPFDVSRRRVWGCCSRRAAGRTTSP